MFGIGPTEMIFFLVILLLVVGPERLPTFMRTVGKGVRQVRNASREFKEAIGLDELMREGDPFRTPPVHPPRARPVPVEDNPDEPSDDATFAPSDADDSEHTQPIEPEILPEPPTARTVPPPLPQSVDAAKPVEDDSADSEPSADKDLSPGANVS